MKYECNYPVSQPHFELHLLYKQLLLSEYPNNQVYFLYFIFAAYRPAPQPLHENQSTFLELFNCPKLYIFIEFLF